MDVDPELFKRAKEKAHVIYTTEREIWCPHFQTRVVLNADGFHLENLPAEMARC